MLSRRCALGWLATACASFAGPGTGAASTGTPATTQVPAGETRVPAGETLMPAEETPHERTFMGWPSRYAPWGRDLPSVRSDIAGLARTIARFEPVVLLARPDEADDARRACGGAVEVLPVPVDDLWLRDTGPTFVRTESGLAGVDTRFNGWGGKQRHPADGEVARRLLQHYGIPRIPAPLVTEGGALEVDGDGTLLATESSIVNDNRNPGRSRAELESGLKAAFGARKVIWLPGVRGADITDSHVDGLVRCTSPATMLLDRPGPEDSEQYHQARAVLTSTTDAAGRKPEIVDLPRPDPGAIGRHGKDFFGSYINYYVAGGAVIAPIFGDRAADDRAAGILRELYPGREVVGVRIEHIAEGGGGIHCATQQQPRR